MSQRLSVVWVTTHRSSTCAVALLVFFAATAGTNFVSALLGRFATELVHIRYFCIPKIPLSVIFLEYSALMVDVAPTGTIAVTGHKFDAGRTVFGFTAVNIQYFQSQPF